MMTFKKDKVRIDHVWEKVEKISIYIVITTFVVGESLSVFIRKIADLMDNHGSLLLISLILLFIFRFVDKNIKASKQVGLRTVERFTTDVIGLLKKSTYSEIKIFANSSFKYFNAISESQIKIDSVILLIRDFGDIEKIQFPTTESCRQDFKINSQQLVNNWKALLATGKIKKLEICLYPFDSILHFILIDNSILHFGLLKPKHNFPGSDLNGSFIVENDTDDGRTLIGSFNSEFMHIKKDFSKPYYISITNN